jgi:hypothetical protein
MKTTLTAFLALAIISGLAFAVITEPLAAQVPTEPITGVPYSALDGGATRGEKLAQCYAILNSILAKTPECAECVCPPTGPPGPPPPPPTLPPVPPLGCLNAVTSVELTEAQPVHFEKVAFPGGAFTYTGSFMFPEGTELINDDAARSLFQIIMDNLPWGKGGLLANGNVKGKWAKLTAKRQHKDSPVDNPVGPAVTQAKPNKGQEIIAGVVYFFTLKVDDDRFSVKVGDKDQLNQGTRVNQVGRVPTGKGVSSVDDEHLEALKITIGHASGGPGPEVPVPGAVFDELCLRADP